MNEENKLIQCNFQYTDSNATIAHIRCSLKATRHPYDVCGQEKCRLVKIESTVRDIYKILTDSFYNKQTP